MLKKIIVLLLYIYVLTIQTSAFVYKDDVDFKQYIYDKCGEYNIDQALICGVIECESGWRSDALNYDGSCIGLMQINKVNLLYLHEKLGTEDLYDPYQNVEAGIYMLSGYMNKYNDVDMTLMCYNCGEYGAMKLKEQGISSTYYSRKVREVMAKYAVEAEECVSIDKMFSLTENEGNGFRTNIEYRLCKE